VKLPITVFSALLAMGAGRAAAAAERPLDAIPAAKEDCAGEACVRLGAPLLKAQPLQAASLFKKGCNSGGPVACSMLAHTFQQGLGVPVHAPTAAQLFQKSCDGGYAKACHNLALMLGNGAGVPADMPRAVTLLDKACTGQAWKACASLGDYYLDQGQKAKALPLLKLACEKGDALGCESLKKAQD